MIAFAMLILQVYMLLFENRKFTAVANIPIVYMLLFENRKYTCLERHVVLFCFGCCLNKVLKI